MSRKPPGASRTSPPLSWAWCSLSCPGGSWTHRPFLPLTLTCCAFPELPEQGHSLGLLEGPLRLFLLLSLPVLSCSPVSPSYSFYILFSLVGYPQGPCSPAPSGFAQLQTLSLCLALASKAAWDLCPTLTPPCSTLACLDVRGGGGAPPVPPFLSPNSLLTIPSLLPLPGPAVCMAHAASGERHTPSDSCGSASRCVFPATARAKSCRLGTRSQGLCLGAAAAGAVLRLVDRVA